MGRQGAGWRAQEQAWAEAQERGEPYRMLSSTLEEPERWLVALGVVSAGQALEMWTLLWERYGTRPFTHEELAEQHASYQRVLYVFRLRLAGLVYFQMVNPLNLWEVTYCEVSPDFEPGTPSEDEGLTLREMDQIYRAQHEERPGLVPLFLIRQKEGGGRWHVLRAGCSCPQGLDLAHGVETYQRGSMMLDTVQSAAHRAAVFFRVLGGGELIRLGDICNVCEGLLVAELTEQEPV